MECNRRVLCVRHTYNRCVQEQKQKQNQKQMNQDQCNGHVCTTSSYLCSLVLTFLGPDEADRYDALPGGDGVGAKVFGGPVVTITATAATAASTEGGIVRPNVQPLVDGQPGQAGPGEEAHEGREAGGRQLPREEGWEGDRPGVDDGGRRGGTVQLDGGTAAAAGGGRGGADRRCGGGGAISIGIADAIGGRLGVAATSAGGAAVAQQEGLLLPLQPALLGEPDGPAVRVSRHAAAARSAGSTAAGGQPAVQVGIRAGLVGPEGVEDGGRGRLQRVEVVGQERVGREAWRTAVGRSRRLHHRRLEFSFWACAYEVNLVGSC